MIEDLKISSKKEAMRSVLERERETEENSEDAADYSCGMKGVYTRKLFISYSLL